MYADFINCYSLELSWFKERYYINYTNTPLVLISESISIFLLSYF
jgi:hypothetical protein